MAIVTFWNGTDEQCGCTSSSMAFATHLAIQHNIKVLLITTAFKDSMIKDGFWQEQKKKKIGLFTSNRGDIDNSGIEGLDRVIRSNRISPEIITQYTKVVLTNRFEILLGVEEEEDKYNEVKDKYTQIITLANKYYDMVIVDLDRRVGEQIEKDILTHSTVVVALVSQRAKEIQQIQNLIEQNEILQEKSTVMAIGKYLENTKYNAKNITRSLLKQKNTINCIPYNTLFFEATQEGMVIDLFLNFMRLNDKDENYEFVNELKKLEEAIKTKIDMLQMVR